MQRMVEPSFVKAACPVKSVSDLSTGKRAPRAAPAPPRAMLITTTSKAPRQHIYSFNLRLMHKPTSLSTYIETFFRWQYTTWRPSSKMSELILYVLLHGRVACQVNSTTFAFDSLFRYHTERLYVLRFFSKILEWRPNSLPCIDNGKTRRHSTMYLVCGTKTMLY